MNPIDMIFDEENTDPIVLYNENNEAVEFEQIAVMPLDGKVYVILRPTQQMAGVGEDEALVFSIEELDDEDALVIVEEDGIIDAVFALYYQMLEEAQNS